MPPGDVTLSHSFNTLRWDKKLFSKGFSFQSTILKKSFVWRPVNPLEGILVFSWQPKVQVCWSSMKYPNTIIFIIIICTHVNLGFRYVEVPTQVRAGNLFSFSFTLECESFVSNDIDATKWFNMTYRMIMTLYQTLQRNLLKQMMLASTSIGRVAKRSTSFKLE